MTLVIYTLFFKYCLLLGSIIFRRVKEEEMTDVKRERGELEKKCTSLEDDVHVEEEKRLETNVVHEIDVRRTIEEMEARFVLSEKELRKKLEEKVMDLERARKKIIRLEEVVDERSSGGGSGGSGGDGGATTTTMSSSSSSKGGGEQSRKYLLQIESLKNKVSDLEYELEMYQVGKIEVLKALEISRKNVLESL